MEIFSVMAGRGQTVNLNGHTYERSNGRLIPKAPIRHGFPVGADVFVILEHEVRGIDVCYPGKVWKLPEGRGKTYHVKFVDEDIQSNFTVDQLLTKIPISGFHYDDGNYSPIINGNIVRVPDDSSFSESNSDDEASPVIPPDIPFTLPQRVDPEIPMISEVILRSSPILKHVPVSCRPDFGKAFNSLIYELTTENSDLAWVSYFMFIPVVLLPFGRGGKKNKNDAIKFTKSRIKEWNGADIDDYRLRVLNRIKMWEDLPDSSFVRKSDPIASCKRYVAAGRYANACRALADAESIAPLNDQTFDLLEGKHPNGPPVERLEMPPSINCTADQVRDAIASFPNGSGAGPSRLSPDHIKDAAVPYLQTSVYDQLAILINHVVAGKVPLEVQPYLAGAFLSPLIKKDGGIRPVACGDVVRRTAGKVLAKIVREKAKALFAPFQFGVAVPRGAEAVIHLWREVLAGNIVLDDDELVALKIDLSNAFNNVDRNAMLRLCHRYFPELYAFVWYCYGNMSYLFIRGMSKIIRSRQGAQQGDPLASLLSCLVFHEVIAKINSLPDIKLNAWFMDDGGIIANYKSIKLVLELLDEVKSDLGVFLNNAKTEIIWLRGNPHPSNPFEGFNFKTTSVDELEMLGSPIGSRVWCNEYVHKKAVIKNEAVIEKLDLLNDSQAAFLILRSCLSFTKMVYFMRTVPHGYMSEATKKFDEMTLDCLVKLISYKIDTPGYNQLQLNVSNGGLGIRNTTNHHSASFYSSLVSCLPLIKDISRSNAPYSTVLSVVARVNLSNFISWDEIANARSQADFSARIDKYQALKLYDSANEVDKARLLSSKQKHCADFLFAPPIAGLGLKLTSEEWSVAVAYKLGLKFNASTFKCNAKGCDQLMDIQALHSLRCGTEGDRLKRHNNLKRFFFKQCEIAQRDPVLEPKNLLRNCGLKPADWGIPDYKPGKFMAYDVAVTDPTQIAFVKKSSATPGYAAEKYAEFKEAKYADALAKDDSILFTPIIAESYGGWNKEAYDFFNNLATWLTPRDHSLSKSQLSCRLFQRASVILQRGNARMILSRLKRS